MVRLLAVALVLLAAAFAQNPGGDSAKESAMLLARKARRAEKAGHFADAYVLWSEAGALQPRNRTYRGRMSAVQSRAALSAKATLSDAVLADAAELPLAEAGAGFDSLTAREFALARQPLAPPTLRGNPGTADFELNLPPRELITQVAHNFGLDPVFDGDYPPTGPPIRFRVTAVDYRQALRDLEAATDSFVVPLSAGIFMVARDTAQKRADLEQTVAVSIPVPDALSAQELTDIAQVVRQTTGIEKLALDNARGAIVMRDRISRILPAQALIEQLIGWRPQVMVDLELLEVSDSDVVKYGFTPTTQIPAVFLGRVLRNVITAPAGVTNLVTFGGGKTLIGLGVASAQALFNESISSGRSLYRAQIRSVENQPATFHVGEKYPIVTSGYYGPPQQGQVFQPPPAYTFEDLGLQLKVTPHMHQDGEVTVVVETSFELLTGSAVNGIPVVGRRQLNTQVRLREGEWAVVAGLMGDTDSKAQSGFAGLSSLPLIGQLFRQTSKDKERKNVLIAIRPHSITLGNEMAVPKPLRVGTETRPATPLL